MDNRNFTDIGEQIENIVQDAVDKLDFEKLNKNISNTVNGALEEVQHQIHKSQQRKTMHYQTSHQKREIIAPERKKAMRHEMTARPNSLPIAVNPKGSISGVLYTVFGSIGLGTFGLGYMITMIVAIAEWDPFLAALMSAIMLPFILVFSVMLGGGVKQLKKVKRFREYVKVIKGRTYCTIQELAYTTHRKERFVVKDLEMMIRQRMFLEGRLDEDKTCLMLTYDVFQQYKQLQDNKKTEVIEQKKEESVQQKKEETREAENVLDNEIRRVIKDGRDCIAQVKAVNAAIPGEEISGKLHRLETVIGKILNYVEEHPDQIVQIEKFMEYYLPTTLKLVNTYKTLDEQVVEKDNIATAKREIEKTLDTINVAFENLLDSLFENIAMDISTDITVLENMLAREGLTKKDFDRK